MFRMINLVAAILVIAILAAMSLPIYKSYLIKKNTIILVDELTSHLHKTLEAYSISNPWPQNNMGPGFSKTAYQQIPLKFHLIWLGGKIPANYIKNLQTITQLSKRVDASFSINIWTDQSSRAINNHEFDRIPGLKIRNIESEILNKVQASDSPYTYFEQTNFLKWILFEYLAPANYAAISDLLRIEILRTEGGIYLDTDVEIANEKYFTLSLLPLINKVAYNGGISCLRDQSFTNNNLIIAANDMATKEKLKALVNYMSISMSNQYVQQMQQYFQNATEYHLAKKCPIALASKQKNLFTFFPQHAISNHQILTMAEGPYKFATFAEQYIPIFYVNKHIRGAPGLVEMERIFKCRVNDNTWLDKSLKSPIEQQELIKQMQSQIDFYLHYISDQDLKSIALSLNDYNPYYSGLNLSIVFSRP